MSRRQYLIAIVIAIAVTILACVGIMHKFMSGNESKDINSESVNEGAIDEDGKPNNGIKVTRLDRLTDAENQELLNAYKIMKENNPDFAGYVRIEGTELAYPVMYTPDEPEKYIHKDINGIETDNGLPFIDTRCNLDPDSDNIIIYGHNMKDGSMFASIINYQDKSYYEKHPIIRFDTPDEVREYQVMAVFYDRVYYTDESVPFKFYDFIDADDEADYDYAIEQYLKKSVYDTGVKAHYGDKLLTLVTCAYHTENGRFVVVAKRRN